MKEKMLVSFSGGRTSAYMTKMLLDRCSDKYDFAVVFANTGQEHPSTLDFVHNCDKHFGFNTIWLEADVMPNDGEGTKYKIVDYKTACRPWDVNGPFEMVIQKYGIPNTTRLHCTRELKLQPIKKFAESIGYGPKNAVTAVGLRVDELRRVSKQASDKNLVYPLIDWWPTDKGEILDWWSQQPFDLEIPDRLGNCVWCYKKSDRKHFQNILENPDWYAFPERMEAQYGHVKAGVNDRHVFFRNQRDTKALKNQAALCDLQYLKQVPIRPEENSGCSESCEAFLDEGT